MNVLAGQLWKLIPRFTFQNFCGLKVEIELKSDKSELQQLLAAECQLNAQFNRLLAPKKHRVCTLLIASDKLGKRGKCPETEAETEAGAEAAAEASRGKAKAAPTWRAYQKANTTNKHLRRKHTNCSLPYPNICTFSTITIPISLFARHKQGTRLRD